MRSKPCAQNHALKTMRSKPCAQNSASGNQTTHRVFSDSIRQLDSPGLQNRHDNKIFGVRISTFAYRMLYMGPLRTRPQPTGSCRELPAYSLTTDSLFEQRQCLGKHGLWTTVMNQVSGRPGTKHVVNLCGSTSIPIAFILQPPAFCLG